MFVNYIARALTHLATNLSDLSSGNNTESSISSVYLADRTKDIVKEDVSQTMPDLFVERECYSTIIKQLKKVENSDMHSLTYSYSDLAQLIHKLGGSDDKIEIIINVVFTKLVNNKNVTIQKVSSDINNFNSGNNTDKKYVLKW